ncbi:hypothetical protein M406DRAFT_72819 [Cryphonectria parasitica EP155]|uniref:Uncharacterized protein n=1 Tax=Cryphonectria parasitica (strain ATCC 38755 / EP155) TaxID=660469 RepID=A0A9P4XWX0_CRYP1|nr:uncharacterized protein M406DRAFT_72819 [Cryphonectria parasitica EP155]KAF3762832.1 hypothetical protein M406DRAFT_72819 [Cryphonectria parasitica EP155]
MDGLQAIFGRYSPELELLFRIAIFTPFIPKSMKHLKPKTNKAKNFPYIPMLVHLVTGPLQFIRYYAKYVTTRTYPLPDEVDFVLMSLFLLSSALLQISRSKANSTIIKTTFQTTVIQQGVPFFLGYHWNDANLFRLSVQLLNWFSWFRITHRVLPRVVPHRFKGLGKYVVCYEATLVLSSCVAMWEVGYPGGVGAFLGILTVLLSLERTLTRNIASMQERHMLRRLLVNLGLVDFEILRPHKSE